MFGWAQPSISTKGYFSDLNLNLYEKYLLDKGRHKKLFFFSLLVKNGDPPSPFFDHLSFFLINVGHSDSVVADMVYLFTKLVN